MCVLASGSSGNCTVIMLKRGLVRRVVLIDLGLSPRRTFRMLAGLGIGAHQLDDCLVTHLDHDHFAPSWLAGLPAHARIRLHDRHHRVLENMGFASRSRIQPFGDGQSFDLDPGVTVHPITMCHDDEGVSNFRIDLPGLDGGSLGFATDLGHVTADLVSHMRGVSGQGPVDTLAIESNYCPQMQLASARPEFLKRRIMGGKGHLSNQQALEAIQAIQPREHVVLLHLSRECNCPNVVSGLHAGSDYALTISRQHEPTRWIRLAPSASPARTPHVSVRIQKTQTLWDLARS